MDKIWTAKARKMFPVWKQWCLLSLLSASQHEKCILSTPLCPRKSHDTGKTEQKLGLIWLCCKAQFLTTWIWVVWQVPMPHRSSGFQVNLWLPSGTIKTQHPCHVSAHINCTSPHLTQAFPHLSRKKFSKDRGQGWTLYLQKDSVSKYILLTQ